MFSETNAPAVSFGDTPDVETVWRTWSAPFRRFAIEWYESLREEERAPRLVQASGPSLYDRSFTSAVRVSDREDLLPELQRYAESLRRLEPGKTLILLDGLLDSAFNGGVLAAVLAALRDALVVSTGSSRAALYAPLGTTGPNVGGFKLHADLYIPRKLMIVFDDVPADHSGATMLLSKNELLESLKAADVPEAVGQGVRDLLEGSLACDGFAQLQGLLYPRQRAVWSDGLEGEMARRQQRVSLGHGQGYLIDDREWLHGREAPHGGVSSNRLHRLVFS